MSSQPLSAVLQTLLLEPRLVGKRWVHPVLVWEPPRNRAALIDATVVTDVAVSLEHDEPVVIEVVKGAFPNAFPFGVTIGHAENNDVVLRHQHVSRFHAYVKVVDGKRCLVDAASRNGTWLNGQRLEPTRPVPLPPQALLRLGGADVTYLEPERLVGWLATRLNSANGARPPPFAERDSRPPR